MIKRTINWDLDDAMRQQYGFVAGIVYAQPSHSIDPTYYTRPAPACPNILRVKQWAYQRFGNPAVMVLGEIHVPTDCEWFAGRTSDDEYTVAFKEPKYRDFALLM
jgi:hypothetical protein